ncbi:hypothetical protein BASA50_002024 [Batrachochytrium salamandrivorans]|uniref:Ion transport domain-containing protein n=1 Tax=Batrachochytrium salamandrivorans TaxID=1357716 RepID=A0ABQ8FMI3_9FUNG|nr:hypothetical protein BASA62_003215 [Batrachochytrium salamandrivorans]KAH6580756.1 hypothetical protein BASA61_009430 [Batrachochytrium salamandrivorans]KAH6583878.1 hypothetical protein BASA60_001191 [Batrachochytrium salamandrivorans]KAH6600856.1 hypothetical protein BASA50_002024 [Batrachochytrium salamandrivorans]KAH9266636.1 hypothetical protein BASA83_010441 [Batrachochytrium salamandrivorans]
MHSTASDTTLSSDTCIAVCPSAIEITLPARIDVAVEMNGRAEQSQHTTSQNQQTTSMDMSASDPSQRALTDRVEVRMQSGHQSQPIPARQPILPTPRPHSCPEPTRPQQLAEVLVSVDPIAPPPYSPSREAPPPYRVQVKQVKTSKISHTLALVSLFLVTFDMIFTVLLVGISGIMILYAGTGTGLAVAVPIAYTITACFGRAGLIYDNVSAVLFYLVMLLIRLFLDIGTMVYMSPAFTTQPFFMSTFEFVLTLPVSGVRSIQTLLMPCFDQLYFRLSDGECTDLVQWNGAPLDFTPILVALLLPHLMTIIVHSIHLSMMQDSLRTAQVGIDADAGRRAAAASAALEAMHRLSLQSHPQWSRVQTRPLQPYPILQQQRPRSHQQSMHQSSAVQAALCADSSLSQSEAIARLYPRGSSLGTRSPLIVSLSRPTRSSTQRQTPLIQLHEQNNGASLYPQWVFPRGTLLGEMEARQASSSPSAQSRTESTTN